MKKGPSLEGLIVRTFSGRTQRVMLVGDRDGYSAYRAVDRAQSSSKIGILLEDIPVIYGRRKIPIMWGDFIGFNLVSELSFFSYNGLWYKLDAHLKNRPSKIICNTVNHF